MRLRLILLAGLAVVLIANAGRQPQIALAHADLLRAEPAAGSELQKAPQQMTLYFSQGLKQQGSFVQIEDADGDRKTVDVLFDAADAKAMRAVINEPLPPGTYTVRWQTLSADDDDYHDGSYTLTILNPDGSRPGGTASGDGAEDDGGSGDTLVLVAVSAVVIAAVGALALYIRRSGRQSR